MQPITNVVINKSEVQSKYQHGKWKDI